MPKSTPESSPKCKKLSKTLADTDLHNKKVTLVITRLDRGGSAELTQQLAAGLTKRGFQVLLISGKTIEPLWDPLQYAQANGFSIQFVESLIRPLQPFKDFQAFLQLVAIFRTFRPDILHTNSSKAGILGRLAGHYCRIPKIFHSPHGHIFYGYYSQIISRVFILLEKLAAHYTTKIFNLTEAGRQDHIAMRVARPEKFVVSSCGVDLHPFYDNPSRNISNPPNNSLAIIWIGRLVPIKNLQMLLNALVNLKQSNLKLEVTIVGDGELRSASEEFVAKQHLENVQFLGYRHDIPGLLARHDLFVLTSLNEGFGRVLVEAMACGLVIVATRVGGVPEVIQHQKNGLLVESRNHRELADSIQYLFENRKICRNIGMFNRKCAEFYSLNNYISRVINFYNEF